MCGICGAFSYTLSAHELGVVQQMFICNSVRGLDSAGAFAVFERNLKGRVSHPVYYHKDVTDPTELIRRTSKSLFVSELDKQTDLQAIVCHNRLATVGDVTKENAHPFVFNNVAGVHNGTVSHKWTDGPTDGTDSAALYHQINERGLEDPVKEMGSGWGNAYALVYWDRRDKTINFLRNSERPLAYAVSGGTLFFASELQMLEWILSRNRINTKASVFPIHKHHKYFLESARPTTDVEIKDLTPPARTYVSTSYYDSDYDKRKAAEAYAPNVEFGFVRVFTGDAATGKRFSWRRIGWLDGSCEVVYSGISLDTSKTAASTTSSTSTSAPVVVGPLSASWTPPALGANATALELVLENVKATSVDTSLDTTGIGSDGDTEVDPNEDVPFVIDRIRTPGTASVLEFPAGHRVTGTTTSSDKTSTRSPATAHTHTHTERGIYKLRGENYFAKSIDEAVKLYRVAHSVDKMSRLQQAYIEAELRKEIRRLEQDLNDRVDDLYNDCTKAQDTDLDDQTARLVKESESDTGHSDDDYILDSEYNYLTYKEFDRILEEGCVGCGMSPAIEDIEIDDDQVSGVFFKDDTGAVRYKCDESKRDCCACFSNRASRLQ